MPTRNDRCLIIILLAVSFLPPLFVALGIWQINENPESPLRRNMAYITVCGKLYRRLELNSTPSYQEFTIKTPYGSNTVVVRNGSIYVGDADCKDKICVKHPPANSPGDIIACLPHKLIIEIKKE